MRRSLIPYLIAALLFQVGFLTVRLAHALRPSSLTLAPAADVTFAQLMRWRRSVCDPAKDPALGIRPPALQLVGQTGAPFGDRSLRGHRTVLLFAAGSGCSLNVLLSAWSRLSQQVPGSAVVLVTPRREIEATPCGGTAGRVRIVPDPSGQIAKKYNARWRPRAYAIDEHGNLCYAQPTSTPDAQAPREVRALWGVD
jgi:hypothetical protein